MTVRQLLLVVEAIDFEEAVAFYRDALGLEVGLDLESEGGAHVVILDAGRATLEISNPAQVALIDEVEVGRRVSPHLRVAFEVDDATATTHGWSTPGLPCSLRRRARRGSPSTRAWTRPPTSSSRCSRSSRR